MSTVEELRRVLAELADTVKPDAATAIRQRIGEIERDTVAQSHQQRR
ncbi:hypothetical protein SK854_30180 [Lentzea sp. BCCO 10_0061]|uniref:Uncharacterized protein n=1 Tax=Lentzea sokolovensis TaxID=3095429 RepID=A0ABU4V618_9PSEU|nr:hypothetical protein [Lentzea sp. BCCO 10_0061]MDX8146416.1 hypothetical protein [Lentzea sp. BCCO 10_0061]